MEELSQLYTSPRNAKSLTLKQRYKQFRVWMTHDLLESDYFGPACACVGLIASIALLTLLFTDVESTSEVQFPPSAELASSLPRAPLARNGPNLFASLTLVTAVDADSFDSAQYLFHSVYAVGARIAVFDVGLTGAQLDALRRTWAHVADFRPYDWSREVLHARPPRVYIPPKGVAASALNDQRQQPQSNGAAEAVITPTHTATSSSPPPPPPPTADTALNQATAQIWLPILLESVLTAYMYDPNAPRNDVLWLSPGSYVVDRYGLNTLHEQLRDARRTKTGLLLAMTNSDWDPARAAAAVASADAASTAADLDERNKPDAATRVPSRKQQTEFVRKWPLSSVSGTAGAEIPYDMWSELGVATIPPPRPNDWPIADTAMLGVRHPSMGETIVRRWAQCARHRECMTPPSTLPATPGGPIGLPHPERSALTVLIDQAIGVTAWPGDVYFGAPEHQLPKAPKPPVFRHCDQSFLFRWRLTDPKPSTYRWMCGIK